MADLTAGMAVWSWWPRPAYAVLGGNGREDRNVAVDWFEVIIPPAVVGSGERFVMSASVSPSGNGFRASVDYGVARRPVAPCRVVDAP